MRGWVRALQPVHDMADGGSIDYYDVLQLSVNAEPDMVHRVYRLLAQRFHPDNAESGNADRFRQIAEAYRVLSDPEERARYDVVHEKQRQERWRLVELGGSADHDFALEQRVRLTVLEVLYTRRRTEPQQPGVFHIDLEKLTGQPAEHLEFTIWYLVQKKLVMRTDNSLLAITADGIDFLEERYQSIPRARQLAAVNG
jgi:curved DNA-binding protein CbpA